MKLRELMMVIEIEVNKLYDPGGWDRVAQCRSLRNSRILS